ncbi:glucose-6-phosphate isomerase [Paenibacillus sp. Root52]|uniref:Quercetin dioxygenase-like cupin family protein n=1 Tax=Paenibacillus amylolyticus TaxID=1451 RepID=A0AAP5H0Q5_PAEAM|nr:MULTISPECIES: cupin domain-containing protein [Paenibacillus]KQY94043.1 glucose-6-phosphate isomerase [Paenibacillus sp. Root52]MDR6721994.1 quercetin dioxygenase-like cupin family protein [Paenibacillus amylolyticus]
MIDPILQAPNVQLAGDSTALLYYKRDPRNYVTQLFGEQLPTIKNGFFNVHMSKGIIVQPHWHTNTTEMIVLISGEITTSVFDPFTRKRISYHLIPGQVAIFPKGWFHWFVADTDDVHLLTIFDVPTPDIVLGADFLAATPPEVAHRAYCIDEEAYAKAVASIQNDAILGPPIGCVEPAYDQTSQPSKTLKSDKSSKA